MGTNYYVRKKKCPHCGHTPDGIHIGKSSYGWQFSFQYNGGKFYRNVTEMKRWLDSKIIVDEHGNRTSQKDFWKMVEEKQKDPKNKNHTVEVMKSHPDSAGKLIGGYSFSDVNFS